MHLVRRFASRSVGLTLGFALISLAVAGCFQAAGAALEATPTSNIPPTAPATETQVIPTDLPTELPTELPTQQPGGEVTQPPVDAPTETPFEQPTEIPTQQVVEPPTEIPTDFPTEIPTEFPTETAVVVTETPQEVAQNPTPVAPFGDGPQATQTAMLATIFAQATQILADATSTAAFDQTATATAQGTFVPGGEASGATQATLAPGGGPLTNVTGTPQGTPGAAGSGAAGALTGDCVYTVAEGDRVYRIALRFGLTIAQLTRANGIVNADLIVPGQRLRIPNCFGTPTPVQGTATLAPTGTGTVTLTPSANSGQVYVVQQGDTLYGIASRYGVRVMALAQANGITNINLIYIGQRLVIP